MKKTCLFFVTIMMMLMMSLTAFAGVWRTGAEPNQNRYWYDNEDGTYAHSGWFWIDGNQDGSAECYYFDGEGWMLSNTTTPDGYQVNEDGAWVSANGVERRTAQAAAVSEDITVESGDVLVVYFSRTGTTERAAQQIGQLTGGSVLELEAADPYNGSYDATLDRAQRERNANARPALTTTVENMEDYDTVFVGYPIWWGDAPMVIDTFLESYDFSGKTIVPFCTSGSSGIGTSMTTIRNLCPNSNVLQGIRVGDTSQIQPWLEQLGLLAQ